MPAIRQLAAGRIGTQRVGRSAVIAARESTFRPSPAERGIVVNLAILLRRGPCPPLIVRRDDRHIVPTVQFILVGALGFQIVEIFQEQHPLGLFGVVQFRRAALLVPEFPVDIVECVFEYGRSNCVPGYSRRGICRRGSLFPFLSGL